ncbi:MAG: hypothetical protein JO352_10475 [Chloroflexi bacterium]|nr:hypothetical protein [Chloroflexota bacterium]
MSASPTRVEIHADRIAELEAGGWRAYYDRDWPRVIRLMVALNQEQFHIPFPLSVVAAMHVARASIAWAPVEHEEAAVRHHLRRFYRMARRWSDLEFDPHRAADLEIGYWIEHRRLLGEADKSSFVDAMAALHAELFQLPISRMQESAEWRVKANNTVDLITGGDSQDPEADWAKLEEELRHCYRAIDREVNASTTSPSGRGRAKRG